MLSMKKDFNSTILTFFALPNCFQIVKFQVVKSSILGSLCSNQLKISENKYDKKQEQNLVTIC